jgi:hypothetical protein
MPNICQELIRCSTNNYEFTRVPPRIAASCRYTLPNRSTSPLLTTHPLHKAAVQNRHLQAQHTGNVRLELSATKSPKFPIVHTIERVVVQEPRPCLI